MDRYAINERTISDAVSGGGLLVVAQWEASELFLIGRGRENPAQFLFYELFRDEAAFKAHRESAHFKTCIAGEALPLLAKRERAQYALL
jgi:hypothetical protein